MELRGLAMTYARGLLLVTHNTVYKAKYILVM